MNELKEREKDKIDLISELNREIEEIEKKMKSYDNHENNEIINVDDNDNDNDDDEDSEKTEDEDDINNMSMRYSDNMRQSDNIFENFNTNNINNKGITFEDRYINPPTDVTNEGITDNEQLSDILPPKSNVLLPELESGSQQQQHSQQTQDTQQTDNTQQTEINQDNLPLKRFKLSRRRQTTKS